MFEGLHAYQPRAPPDLLQANVCLCHVHQVYAGVNAICFYFFFFTIVLEL